MVKRLWQINPAAGVMLVLSCAPAARELAITERLPNDQHYVWTVRAWHADEHWVPAGDSLDMVLLRDRCGVPAGHGMNGCYAEEDSSVHPRWTVADQRIARVRPLQRGSWRFGPGSAGSRIYGRVPGVTPLIVQLPQGAFSDTIRVLPSFDRLRIEPRDSVFFVGDTIRFRIMGLDRAGRFLTPLPWPFSFGQQIAPADSDGVIPIVFEGADHPTIPARDFVVVIGSKADTLHFRFADRPVRSDTAAQPHRSVEYRRVTPAPPQVVARGAGRSSPLIPTVPGNFLLGLLYDCLGQPLNRAPVLVTMETPTPVDTTVIADSLGRILIGPLKGGAAHVTLRSIGYTSVSFQRMISDGALDTLLVQFSASPGLIEDCICADGRGFGSQCCRGTRTAYVCSPASP